MSVKVERICDVCGKVIEAPESGFVCQEYGIVRLDGSGQLFLQFDACPQCFKKLIDMLETHMDKESDEESHLMAALVPMNDERFYRRNQ